MVEPILRLLVMLQFLLINIETYESKLLNTIHIPHNAPVGYVTKFSHKDADHFIDFSNKNVQDLFQQTQDGAIKVAKPLFELAGVTVDLPVKGSRTDAVSEVLHIKIVKSDSFVFPEKKYIGTIKENEEPESPVKIIGHLAITDASYENLTYSLVSAKDCFDVDYVSYGSFHDNRIIALKSLDRELKQNYSIFLQAESVTGELALTEIEVHVLDVNDNIPSFVHSMLEVSAASGPHWDSVVTVKANDKDVNDRISYILEGSDEFVIDSYTGEIFPEEDYLFVGSFLLRVYANDSVGHISDPLVIHIHVESENDVLMFMPSSVHHISKRATTTIRKVFEIVENSTDTGRNALFSVATVQPRPSSSTEEYGLISSSVDIFRQPDINGGIYLKPGQRLDYEDPSHRKIMLVFNRTNRFSPGEDFIKPCPRCSAFIMKMNDGSCNHMTCPVCGAEFCWLCMKEISDLHYLSPSGCTFWGKKPWSRKKKILWQLGTLVGAPVGITLVAGIAIPAMIIGIPVWVGRKIHSKYETSSRHKRNLAITGGVVASILVAPVIAGLAVGIGVPILLGYVYGVVPISLCRSGGCGITTDGGGVRFEFEENETGIPSGMYPSTDTQSVGTGHHVPNPSIAPSIGEASVGMTNSIYSASGSNMDRVGIIPESDRDSASNRAIAGASLNGSMSGSTYAAVIGLHTKLEVQAEMSGTHSKRASFSSESASANFSIGEKSLGEKSVIGDDCSTKALAGSIVNYKLETGSIAASEVQVDLISNHSISSPSDNDTARSKDADTLSVNHDDKKRTASCPGSPVSGCGSICGVEDGKPFNIRCKRCRRLARQMADKSVTEHMNVHFSDQVSLQSFQAEDLVLDLPMGKQGIDSLSEKCSEALELSEVEQDIEKLNANLASGISKDNSDEPAVLLTEVESDRPRCAFYKDGKDGATERGSSPACLQEDYDKSGSDKENTRDSACVMREFKCEKSPMIKCPSEKSHKRKTEMAESKRTRHRSCELALENGRISPGTVGDGESSK